MVKILLTGTTGQVGWELQRSLLTLGQVITCDRQTLDLANPDRIRNAIKEIQPDLIINPAAYTAVDKAESEPELAMQINGIAPGIMAAEAKKLGATMIHYSTDYVFDGSKDGAYVETDPTNPLGVYGKTKLAGEAAIAQSGAAHLILRTCWVYGRIGKNFMITMLRLFRQKEELRVVADQLGTPTWSRLIAQTTAHIITQAISSSASGSPTPSLTNWFTDRGGVYHLTAAGSTSWHGFAKAIMVGDRQAEQQIIKAIQPISTSEYPTPAKRPANSQLDPTKLCDTFNINLPTWEECLAMVLAEV
ncbi:dTDP-4-dehydrorhamnose reductase [Thalassoporum mexicanum PCC 7367]|uniref:dTDP-4-dehydrorhamnose reductase n=1 Tax=Thalassoporum mexicanum TaxID=3457544 RepID=UPI00029FCAD8|nr:dTDP-4-dehydrorhamnose reductase [Pseudanabaena sp. PCC 7367]AFY68930.1 dTDP-4-dehydrorhamnose reductase [Pseudanabaena sp. PCC 7367]